MLTLPASAYRLRPEGVTAAGVAWACFWAGALLCYLLVLLLLAGVGSAPALAIGFVAFHAGLVASCLAFLRGLQRGWVVALVANGLPVGLFWLAGWSVPAFLARFH
ncbi:MAG TPA: hypothetical protein VJ874_00405 [Candidatus Thermoplasmatota archaeon]|nr:hypothetical protein [Candidatus Thermoplasmatota archaeon]